MPAGRPRLDPDVKHQRLLLRRKRYEEKQASILDSTSTDTYCLDCARNVKKRREAARIGMQKHRIAIAASDSKTQMMYRTMASDHSETYRLRKAQQEREDRRAQHAMQKQTRQDEKAALQKKHQSMAQPAPRLTTAPKLLAKPSRRREDLRAASPTTPTPAPRGPRRAADDSSDEEIDEMESEMESAPFVLARAPRPKRCRHCFSEYCMQICWPIPTFDFDYLQNCPKNDTGPFYAIVCKEYRGGQCAEMQALYPEARTWAAPDWPTFTTLWALDCREYHGHKPSDFTPPPSPTPSSPSSWNPTPSPTPSPSSTRSSPSLRIQPPLAVRQRHGRRRSRARVLGGYVAAACAALPKKAEPTRTSSSPEKRGAPPRAPPPTPQASPKKPARAPPLSKDDLAHLASFRNASYSPRRLEQQFVRVLGPASIIRPLPRELTTVAREIITIVPKSEGPVATLPAPSARDERRERRLPLSGEAGEALAMPAVYAVSGTNRLFQDRARALTAFKRTPGADLLITRDEDEAFEFVTEAN
ncbi:hypothetical protein B0H12DRAFT_1071136 [Mycena haematopus]|nr:hypothetical protein B0H12DRAFT_1071136 [Mycena haematopus]